MDYQQTDAPIGIFTALAWEGAAVRAVLRRVKKVEEQVWRGSTGRQDVLIATGGIGIRRTRMLMERFATTPFCAVLSVGCAGALAPGLSTGQLILASQVCLQAAPDEDRLEYYTVDSGLLAQLRSTALQVGIPQAAGSLLTSPRVLFTPEEKMRQGQRTGAIAVEMESGVHAAFAEQRGLPFLAVRFILDGVNLSIPAVAGLTAPNGEVRYLKAAAHIARHPRHLPALLNLKRARTVVGESIRHLCLELLARW